MKSYERLQQLKSQVEEVRREITACPHTWGSKTEHTGPYQVGEHASINKRIVFAIFRERTCVKCGLLQTQLEVTPGTPGPWKQAL